MKLLADENVDEPIVDWLLTLDIDFRSIRRTTPGISDLEIIAAARAEDRIILTNDLDFGELVYHRGLSSEGNPLAGIILLRVQPAMPEYRFAALRQHWDEIVANAPGNFIVVTGRKLRIRPLT